MFKEGSKGIPDSISELQEMVVELQREKEDMRDNYEMEIHILHEQLRLLRLKMFARISERFQTETDELQLLLFEDLSKDEEEPEKEEGTVIQEHSRKKPGRKRIPEDLPRVETVHDISEEDKKCACGSEKSRIGEETSERMQIEPAKFWVEKHIRPKYACKSCEGVESMDKTVSIAPMPPEMIPKSIPTPSLLTHIFIGKFCDAMPFYRQEQQFKKRYGVEISRSTMCNWAFKVAKKLKPLLEMLRLLVLSGPLISIDETTVQVLAEPDRKPQSKSYAWIFRGGMPGMPGLYYHYAPSRSGKIAENFLKDYEGYVQTDGYAGYNFLDTKPGVIHCGCWAHARRKFNDVVKAAGGKYKGKGKANHALSQIRDLYLIEREAKNKGFNEEQTYQLRQEKSKPIVEKLETWLKENAIKIPPQSLLGKAFNYTLNQWPRLIKYLDNGLVRMDNNLIENAIRPFVIGRKNWLFNVTPEGARASASFYSLIETAKANGLEPSKYLRYLFEKFPYAKTSEDVFNLLPMNISEMGLKK